jgi:hypothetical protein
VLRGCRELVCRWGGGRGEVLVSIGVICLQRSVRKREILIK